MAVHRFVERRLVVPIAIIAALFVVLAVSPSAGAASDGTDIGNGIVILGAKVTCPGSAPRQLDSTQAGAFVQSWLPSSIFGKVVSEKPPSSLPICHLTVGDRWISPKAGELRVYYASDGDNVWVGMPPQTIGPGATVDSERWILAPFAERTKAAFEGHGVLIPVTTPSTVVSSPTSVNAAVSHDRGSSSSGWLIALLVAALVVLGGVIMMISRRRRRSPTAAATNRGTPG
ncbi:MAG: hypothetical protein M3Q30_19965 [Actinomycetota bacterium]|nr:hypothetical protein [Actinomycetota bacterium]